MRSAALKGIGLVLGFGFGGGVEAAEDCEEPTMLSSRLDAIESSIVDDELVEARERVTAALDSLGCLTGVVDAKSLSGIWQASAAIEYFGSSEAGAARDMGRAKAIPGAEFRTRLGVDLERRWQEAVPDRSATLEVASVPENFQLYVDGAPRSTELIELPSGPHVVQVVEDDALRFHRLVNLNHGQRALVETSLLADPTGSRPALQARSLLLWSGIASGGLALGSYGAAVVNDRQMGLAESKAEVERLREQSLRYRNASWVLGAVAAVGVGVHGLF